jgi:hypothetical protein
MSFRIERLPPSVSYGLDARLSKQAECHSYVLEKAVEVDRSVIGVFVEFAEIVFPSWADGSSRV